MHRAFRQFQVLFVIESLRKRQEAPCYYRTEIVNLFQSINQSIMENSFSFFGEDLIR